MIPSSFSRGRALARAAWFLTPYLALGAMVIGALALGEAMMKADYARSHPGRAYLPLGTMPVLAGGVIAGIILLEVAKRFRKARQYPDLLARRLRRVPIAQDARTSSTDVAIEGHVAYLAGCRELEAPIRGTICVYHRVIVDRWDRFSTGTKWRKILDHWMLEPFVVVDDSGFVQVGPIHPSLEAEASSFGDPVGVDLGTSTRIYVEQSASGLQGLSPRARAYIEATPTPYVFANNARIRVTEVIIQEGDSVSVVGSLAEARTHEGSYPRDRSESRLRMGGSPHGDKMLALEDLPRVLLARLDEVRWLIAFERRVVLAVAFVSVLGFVAAAVGVCRFAGALAASLR